MIYYAIRKKNTNLFLPAGRKRGFTHDELTDTKPPRLFLKEKGAKDALRWWLKGICIVTYHTNIPYESGPEEVWTTEKVPTRIANNMEVVKLRLTICWSK